MKQQFQIRPISIGRVYRPPARATPSPAHRHMSSLPTTPVLDTKNANQIDNELCMRRTILAIHNDPSFTSAQKAQKMQELMVPGRFHRSSVSRDDSSLGAVALEGSLIKCLGISPADAVTIKVDDAALQPSFRTDEDAPPQPSFPTDAPLESTADTVLGCKHYRTNCKFRAECCGRWFPCRFCHNEASDHEVDRCTTRFCMCMRCTTIQPAGPVCINPDCAQVLAQHYCDKCRFWDDDPNKRIFHCDKCAVCRVGARENYIHCDKCNACLAHDYHSTHKCIERSLECDCPICGEYLFTTVHPIIFMPCGHGIHFLCHREHLQSSYQCPICLKSVTDMSYFFNQIDLMMANHEMPVEYSRVQSLVLCNDCESKSSVKFHFVYHKCMYCKSYNTKVLKTFSDTDGDGEREGDMSDANDTPSPESNSLHFEQ